MKKPFLTLEETLFFSLQYFPTSKVKTRINIQTLGLNNKTLQNQIKQVDLFNQNSTKTRNYKFDSLNKKNNFYCKSLEMRKLWPCEVEEGLARWGRSNNVCKLWQGEGGSEVENGAALARYARSSGAGEVKSGADEVSLGGVAAMLAVLLKWEWEWGWRREWEEAWERMRGWENRSEWFRGKVSIYS